MIADEHSHSSSSTIQSSYDGTSEDDEELATTYVTTRTDVVDTRMRGSSSGTPLVESAQTGDVSESLVDANGPVSLTMSEDSQESDDGDGDADGDELPPVESAQAPVIAGVDAVSASLYDLETSTHTSLTTGLSSKVARKRCTKDGANRRKRTWRDQAAMKHQESKARKSYHTQRFGIECVRDGARVRVPPMRLVVGDVMCLRVGDVVPADIHLIENYALRVDTIFLTGMRVVSRCSVVGQRITGQSIDGAAGARGGRRRAVPPAQPRSHEVLAGSIVESGRGKGVVVRTGHRTTQSLAISDSSTFRPPRNRIKIKRLPGELSLLTRINSSLGVFPSRFSDLVEFANARTLMVHLEGFLTMDAPMVTAIVCGADDVDMVSESSNMAMEQSDSHVWPKHTRRSASEDESLGEGDEHHHKQQQHTQQQQHRKHSDVSSSKVKGKEKRSTSTTSNTSTFVLETSSDGEWRTAPPAHPSSMPHQRHRHHGHAMDGGHGRWNGEGECTSSRTGASSSTWNAAPCPSSSSSSPSSSSSSSSLSSPSSSPSHHPSPSHYPSPSHSPPSSPSLPSRAARMRLMSCLALSLGSVAPRLLSQGTTKRLEAFCRGSLGTRRLRRLRTSHACVYEMGPCVSRVAAGTFVVSVHHSAWMDDDETRVGGDGGPSMVRMMRRMIGERCGGGRVADACDGDGNRSSASPLHTKAFWRDEKHGGALEKELEDMLHALTMEDEQVEEDEEKPQKSCDATEAHPTASSDGVDEKHVHKRKNGIEEGNDEDQENDEDEEVAVEEVEDDKSNSPGHSMSHSNLLLVAIGDAQALLGRSDRILLEEKVLPLTQNYRERIFGVLESLTMERSNVVALCCATIPAQHHRTLPRTVWSTGHCVLDDSNEADRTFRKAKLTWLGMVCTKDRLRDRANVTLRRFCRAGVRVVLLSTSHPNVVKSTSLVLGFTREEDADELRILDEREFNRKTHSERARTIREDGPLAIARCSLESNFPHADYPNTWTVCNVAPLSLSSSTRSIAFGKRLYAVAYWTARIYVRGEDPGRLFELYTMVRNSRPYALRMKAINGRRSDCLLC